MAFQCTRCGESVEFRDERVWICRSCGKAGTWKDFHKAPKTSAEAKAAASTFLAAAYSLAPLGLDRSLRYQLDGGRRDGKPSR